MSWDESGYFDTTSDIKPLLHLWSLGIEEQFYILWPLILWAAWKFRANIIWTTIILCAASFVLNITNVRADQSGTFYLPQTRAWELLIGAIASAIARKDYYLPRWQQELCSFLGFAFLLAGFIVIQDGSLFPGWQALLPTVGTALIIIAGSNARPNKLISSKAFVSIGLISYPLYLWHWPLLTFPRIIIGETPSPFIRSTALIFAFILAAITYIFIEKPLRRVTSKTKPIALFLGMLCLGLAGLFIYLKHGLPNRAAVIEAKEFNAQFVGPLWSYERNDICMNQVGNPELGTKRWWFCYANNNKTPDILLVGTSYANHYYPGIASILEPLGATVMSLGACQFGTGEAPIDDETTTHPCSGNRAYEERKIIDKIINSSKDLRLVIVGGLLPSNDINHINSVIRRVDELANRNIQVAIIRPHVIRPGDLKGCYSRPLSPSKADCTLPISEREKLNSDFSPLMKAVLEKHPEVIFLDPNAAFCDSEKCSLLIDGMPIYRDQYSHLSEYASKVIAKSFMDQASEQGLYLTN